MLLASIKDVNTKCDSHLFLCREANRKLQDTNDILRTVLEKAEKNKPPEVMTAVFPSKKEEKKKNETGS